jgi:hypothetical protein
MHVLFQLDRGKQRRKERQGGDRVRTLTGLLLCGAGNPACSRLSAGSAFLIPLAYAYFLTPKRKSRGKSAPALKVTHHHSDKHCSDRKIGRLPEKSWRKLSKRKVLFGLIDVKNPRR